MDDDMLDLYITINNLDAESDAKVLEAVQYRPKHPRRVPVSVRASSHDESSGASFVLSDCGAPYYTDRAAQLCSVCNSSAAPTATFSSGALSEVPVPTTISTEESSTKNSNICPSIVSMTSPSFECGCIDRAAQLCSVRGAQHNTDRSIREESQ